MSHGTATAISYPARVAQLAAAHPDRAAIIYEPTHGPRTLHSWRELDARSSQYARLLMGLGANASSIVVVAIPNSPEHFLLCLAAWKLGARVLPLPASMPDAERTEVLELVGREWTPLGIGDTDLGRWPTIRPGDLAAADRLSSAPLPEPTVPAPGIITTSGGSTGRPKVIVNHQPQADVPTDGSLPGLPGLLGMSTGQVQLVAGPLYHGGPIGWSTRGLFHDQTLVLMERFDAARAVDLVERHRVNWMFLVPTMMRRILQLEGLKGRDLSSIDATWHAGGPCPPSVKKEWIELLGPRRVREAFGGSEAAGNTFVSGEEWVARPGTVGRPIAGWELGVFDSQGVPAAPGEVGAIAMRPADGTAPFHYLGADVEVLGDGFLCLGDMGHQDGDGYLFIADRRTDLIITGGANIYPAEVEGALLQHPAVQDSVVVGVPDADLGRTVHAIVQLRETTVAPTPAQLDAHCRSLVAGYKVPRTYEFVTALPRSEIGKIRRSELAAERAARAG
ncbi:MAG: AMP-binding protein [Candidatus Dormibacteria bacterium]